MLVLPEVEVDGLKALFKHFIVGDPRKASEDALEVSLLDSLRGSCACYRDLTAHIPKSSEQQDLEKYYGTKSEYVAPHPEKRPQTHMDTFSGT